eukprot:TRINITY_DN5823_c0_g1_i1.p1 TRINITY_DN5823_c0_g1~~TRINITY_DN5823_c0_g1_i1.p1  ORF type:complete len:542 (-),score=156.98 TRINITY_DN5823_c0_g1_i1:32-1657(-)
MDPQNTNKSQTKGRKRKSEEKRGNESNENQSGDAMQGTDDNNTNTNTNNTTSKRRRGGKNNKNKENANKNIEDMMEGLEMDDDYDDEYEEEEIYAPVDDEDGDMEGDEIGIPEDHTLTQNEPPPDESQPQERKRVWKPGQNLAEGEVLEYDPSAYDMLHRLNVEWPLLSFSVIHDQLGFQRTKFPHTVTVVAGTQCDGRNLASNALVLLKLSNLSRTSTSHHSSDSESDSDSDSESVDEDPIIETKSIKHPGIVNKVKSSFLKPELVASWSANGQVFVWSLPNHIASLSDPSLGLPTSPNIKPIFTFSRHTSEGYALQFSPLTTNKILTGANDRSIYCLEYDGSNYTGNSAPYLEHTSSVEDLEWSPKEENVFASCSADKTIKIWDGRNRTRSAMSIVAHDCDVNVISWSKQSDFLVASGADDGSFNIWDLRNFKESNHVARMKWHGKKITGIEWHPIEAPELVVSGEDGQVTTWDMSLEKEEGEEGRPEGADMDFEVPPQLLFVHQGQRNVKDVHWHPQIPGVIMSTAEDGFNVYKSSNV